MHRCLTVNDILTLIIREFLSPYAYQDDRKNLMVMALTCKAFLGPAMQESWRTVEDLSRFVHTLPDGLVVFTEPEVRRGILRRQWVRPARCGREA